MGIYRNGMSHTAEYNAWRDMQTRCFKKTSHMYHRYGARGITVCSRWLGPKGFDNFLEDMGMKPNPNASIDRKDNDGDYDPENCRWDSRTEQRRNSSATHKITHKGMCLSLIEWAELYGIPPKRFRHRINDGWNIERALNPFKLDSKGRPIP